MERAKVVLVTQVGQGFGRSLALAYGQAGYDVVCADRDVDLAARTAAEIEELGGQAIPIQADTTAALDVQAAFAKVWEIFGSLSGVVHVTSFDSATPFQRLAEGELVELFDETLRSSVLVLRNAQRASPGAWVVLVAPAPQSERPQLAAVAGALARLAASLPSPVPESASTEEIDGIVEPVARLRVNVVVPSRPAADPWHDAPLVHAVRALGGQVASGVHGSELRVNLPPPPRVIEALLPEVQAALDDSVRQDDDPYEDDDDASAPATVPAADRVSVDPLLDEGLDDASLTAAGQALRRLTAGDAGSDDRPGARTNDSNGRALDDGLPGSAPVGRYR